MTRSVIITKEDSWFVAQDIASGVASQGRSIDEALKNLKEAVELYFEGSADMEKGSDMVLLTTMEVTV